MQTPQGDSDTDAKALMAVSARVHAFNCSNGTILQEHAGHLNEPACSLYMCAPMLTILASLIAGP